MVTEQRTDLFGFSLREIAQGVQCAEGRLDFPIADAAPAGPLRAGREVQRVSRLLRSRRASALTMDSLGRFRRSALRRAAHNRSLPEATDRNRCPPMVRAKLGQSFQSLRPTRGSAAAASEGSRSRLRRQSKNRITFPCSTESPPNICCNKRRDAPTTQSCN